jgi:hypothetical protein
VPQGKDEFFYDFEFLFSMRKTTVYLHRRQQDPCENAIRLKRQDIPRSLLLHTAFLNSKLRDDGEQFSNFSGKFRVVEHRVSEGFLWDHEYPERPIYNESVEVRVGDVQDGVVAAVEYRWLSDGDGWTRVAPDANLTYQFPLRTAGSFSADVLIKVGSWPDLGLTKD